MNKNVAANLDKLDLQRRFASVGRLFGAQAQEELARTHVLVAGIGGVGSWAAEALARSGVGALSLVDLDHVAESNINRQVHALSTTLGQAKIQAMAQRIAAINPACRVTAVDDFVSPENIHAILPDSLVAAADGSEPPYIVLDCTDQVAAKIAMVSRCRVLGLPLLVCGAAGGKTDALSLRQGDLADAVNDALLSRLRQQLRKHHSFPKAAQGHSKPKSPAPRMRVSCLWFAQPASKPQGHFESQNKLACAGYGSLVTITASMGMAAANWAMLKSLRL